jgi:hypothetical protein
MRIDGPVNVAAIQLDGAPEPQDDETTPGSSAAEPGSDDAPPPRIRRPGRALFPAAPLHWRLALAAEEHPEHVFVPRSLRDEGAGATPGAAAPTVPAAPRRNPGERPAAARYAGEPPVDAAWLNEREGALKALRAEYEGARAQAQAGSGAGPGWVEDIPRGNPNRDRPASDNRPRAEGPDGRVMVFDEKAFAAHFRAQQSAQPSSALQTLARLYASDARTLPATQPALWTLALQEHALNAGPPPPGRAMGDGAQLQLLDLYLADPQIAALINTYGGAAPPAYGNVAHEQLRLYGAARFAQLCRLGYAMANVRSQYGAALAQAERSGSGPGWVERQGIRAFDPDAFTAWYNQQGGLANKAFAAFYGQSHTSWESDDTGGRGGEGGDAPAYNPAAPLVAHITFDNAQWVMRGVGGTMEHAALLRININDPPRLNNDGAVAFDLEAGWVTDPSNLHEKRDWFETVVQVFIVGVVSYASAGTLGPAVSGFVGGGAAGAVAAAATVGATAALASGAMNGNLTFKSILQGALAGGLSAGLLHGPLGAAVANSGAGAVGTVALRVTVQGTIQALLGGKFSDGAIAGLASGLADQLGSRMNQGIDEAVAAGKMSAAEAIAARTSARIIGSAVRALGHPSDPGYGFASSLVDSLMPTALVADTPAATAAPPAISTAFDDEGNLMPGVASSAAPWADQLQALRERLITQGVDAATAEQVVADYAQRVTDDAFDAFVSAQPRPVQLAGPGSAADVRGAREVIDTIEQRIAQGSLQGPQVGHAIEDAYEAYLRLASTTAAADTPPTVDQERAAARLISLIGDLGQVAQQDGSTLSAEQQALVRQARALQAQSHLPEIYGAAAGGGILALRQSQRLQALQAWAAQPGLRHPNQLIGRTDGGPGQWVYAPRRSSGQDYQEQVSGVPRGIEYEVRGIKIDGYDAGRRVAVDAKDWQGYPPPGTDFWQKGVVKEATDQLDALRGTGVKLEWHVSTPQAAQQVRAALDVAAVRNPGLGLNTITVVAVPRHSGP